jgi:hypothetical protein
MTQLDPIYESLDSTSVLTNRITLISDLPYSLLESQPRVGYPDRFVSSMRDQKCPKVTYLLHVTSISEIQLLPMPASNTLEEPVYFVSI